MRVCWQLIGLLGATPLLAGCGGSLIDPSPPSQSTSVSLSAGAYSAAVPAPVNEIGVCIDPTLSTVPGFSGGALELVRSVVAGWAAPSPPTSVSAAIPPQPGLALEIRQVGTNSYATTNPYTIVRIVAVPGLRARPDATSDAFLAEDPVWRRAAGLVRSQATEARRQAVAGAAQVRSITLDDTPNVYSEILGCVTSLGQTMAAGSRRSIVLFSDLEQNRPPQAGRYLASTRILVVQPCDSGNATVCGALRTKWRGWLRSEGATTVQFIRPEDASSVVPAFVKEVPTS